MRLTRTRNQNLNRDFTFYNKSSQEMGELEDKSVHLMITSPPYPMIKKWDDLFGKVDFNFQHDQLLPVWQECHRVLVDGGIACVNIGDATRSIDGEFQCYPNYAKITMAFLEIGFIPLIPIFWKKISNRPNAFLGSGFYPPNAYVAQDHEYIGIFRKGSLRKFTPKDPIRIESMYTKQERDLWFQQVWNIPGAKGAKESSSFPKEIAYRLIRMFSVIGDTVLDPFCGSGTVLHEAVTYRRIGVGYDIEDSIK